jgi:glycogen debranching enzyme
MKWASRLGQEGIFHPVKTEKDRIRLSYTGSDDVNRATVIKFAPEPKTISGQEAFYAISLAPFGMADFEISIYPEINGQAPEAKDRSEAIHRLEESYRQWDEDCTTIETDNETFNKLVNRSKKDIRVLLTDVGYGRFPLVFVRAMLGLMPDVPAGTIRLSPSLPQGINRMVVKNLRVGNGSLDLLIHKNKDTHTTFKVLHNSTGLQVVTG